MRVLFIGGTGNLSTACTAEALAHGFEVVHLNRGRHPEKTMPGVTTLHADIRDATSVKSALSGRHFDSIVQFIAFRPEHVAQDLELFAGKTGQYLFIGTASAYRKPPRKLPITEDTPLENPYWEYSRLKIDCERLIGRAAPAKNLPYTIVRPSHTYDDGWVPSCFGSASYGVAWRLSERLPVVVPGDGQSVWTLTHASDFAVGLVGLLGNPAALGEAFHITSDEHLTWDEIHRTIAGFFGVEPHLVHVPSDFVAEFLPERAAGWLGDKATSAIFDNSKLRAAVPGFSPRVSFADGIRRSLAWFDAHPDLKAADPAVDAEIDEILRRWNVAMHASLGTTAGSASQISEGL